MPEICIYVMMVIVVIMILFLIGLACHEISDWLDSP